MSSNYCKYHPSDPTCYSVGSKYDTFHRDKPQTELKKDPFEDTFKHTPRRNITPVEPPTVEPYQPTYQETTRRRKGSDYYAPPPARRDFRPVNKRKQRSHSPQNLIRNMTNIEDKQQQFTNPNYGNMPNRELEIMRRRYNKRLEAGKKRAQELLKVGTHEVIESREQHLYGHMTEAAYKHAYKGKKAAMNQLKEGGEYIPELNDYDIIPEFSDYDYIALRNRKTGKLVQAGRGSDTEFFKADANIEQALRGKPLTQRLQKGVNDWFVNAKFFMNKAHETGTYRSQERDLQRFAEAFGQEVGDVDLTGHSKAGATAEYLGKKYGNKVYSFNPAVHPTNKNLTEVHPNTEIHHFGEEFDPVSISRRFHEIPEYMRVHRYTTTPATELDTLGRHDHTQAIPKPERVVNGNIIVKRNTKLKNRLGLMGGTGGEVGKKITGLNNAILAVSSLALEPEYQNKNERFYRKKVAMPIDLTKGVLEFEGVSALGVEGAKGIGRYTQALAPGAAIGAYTDLIMLDQEGNVPLHNALAKVRHAIFGKDAEPDPDSAKPPAIITAFNKHFSKKRYEQDQKIEHAREVYNNEYDGDLTFDQWLGAYHDAEGYRLAKSIEQFGYDKDREHHLSTDEMRLAEAEYNLREEVSEAVHNYPLLEALLHHEGYDVMNGEPIFDYDLAAQEDRQRIKDQLKFGKEFGVELEGQGGGALAFTREQAEAEADLRPATRRRNLRPVEAPEPETFVMNGKTYVEQLP